MENALIDKMRADIRKQVEKEMKEKFTKRLQRAEEQVKDAREAKMKLQRIQQFISGERMPFDEETMEKYLKHISEIIGSDVELPKP